MSSRWLLVAALLGFAARVGWHARPAQAVRGRGIELLQLERPAAAAAVFQIVAERYPLTLAATQSRPAFQLARASSGIEPLRLGGIAGHLSRGAPFLGPRVLDWGSLLLWGLTAAASWALPHRESPAARRTIRTVALSATCLVVCGSWLTALSGGSVGLVPSTWLHACAWGTLALVLGAHAATAVRRPEAQGVLLGLGGLLAVGGVARVLVMGRTPPPAAEVRTAAQVRVEQVVDDYFEAVGQRDAHEAIALWLEVDTPLETRLQKMIAGAEYVRVTHLGPARVAIDVAHVPVTVHVKDVSEPARAWTGTVILAPAQQSWRITEVDLQASP